MSLKEYNQYQAVLMQEVGLNNYFAKTSFHDESLAQIISKYRSLNISSFVLRTALIVRYFKNHNII